MAIRFIFEFVTLAIYAFFMGFTFCDGFKLHVVKKLIFFTVFTIIAIWVLKARGTFDLLCILPIPTVLAFILCWRERGRRK